LLGDATTLRGMNAVYVFFLLSTAVLCVWGAARADFEILNTRARSAAAAILVAVLLAAPEARLPQALIAAARAPAWHAAQMSRFAVLTEERDNNQKRDIVVDPIAPVPFISHADLREEPQAWTNRYCASWFGARSIAVRKDDDVR
jgi:hypothetical protein